MIQLTFLQLITLLAVFNGLIFSVLILGKPENKAANRFLALLIVTMCFSFTPYVLETFIWNKYWYLSWLPFSLSYWIGPAFYFYVKILTDSYTFKKRDLWHFSPIVLNYVHSSYHVLFGYENPYPNFHVIAGVFQSLAILSIFIYALLSYRQLASYRSLLYNRYSNVERISLKWLKNLVLIVVIAFAMVLAFLVISRMMSTKEYLNYWDTLKSVNLVAYIIILQWLIIKGYQQTSVNKLLPRAYLIKSKNVTPDIIEKLQGLIEEKQLYRNPELNLTDLSKAIHISERVLSSTINSELNKNFYQYINEYRVEEVKAKLRDPKYHHLKILSIALDAGFNSKASFNRVFKAYVGETPQQFKSKFSL